MNAIGVPRSGRCGGWVYYMRGSKQHRRRWVKPSDPRTAAQLRARAAFGAASKAWSTSERLTEEQRGDWHREARKVRSRPRLAQSGPLTAQQHFVGKNCTRARIGLGLLLERRERVREKEGGRRQKAEFRAGAQATIESHRCSAVTPPCQRDLGTERQMAAGRSKAASQVQRWQRVAQSTWEQYRGTTLGPRCGHGSMARVSWTVSQCCEGLSCGSARAGGRWLRQGGIGPAGAGVPGRHGSGGRERLARE
jgi:hypothetical protein